MFIHPRANSHDPSRIAVIITGASSGIGRACSLHLDKQGFTVFACVRKIEDGASVKSNASVRLTPLLVDVTDPKSIAQAKSLVARTVTRDGVMLSLVNNAGMILGGPLEFLPPNDLRKELDVNLIGVVQVTQAFLSLIRESKGRIINMSSISGLIAYPFLGPYAATKFALEAISDSLRIELRPWHISVSLIEPGDVATPIWDKSLTLIDGLIKQWPPQAFSLYGPVISMNRRFKKHGIPPEQVAKTVEHALTSHHPRARYRVGRHSTIIDLLRRLPIGIRDRLIAAQLPRYGAS